jgi:signal transduction histidine kinase
MTTVSPHVLLVGMGDVDAASKARSGLAVTAVDDAASARSWFETHSVECLVVGSGVPPAARRDLLDAARAVDEGLPVVLVTDESDEDVAPPASTLHPADLDSLVDCVTALVDDRRDRRADAAVDHLDAVREHVAEAAFPSAVDLLETLCSSLTDFDDYVLAWCGRAALQAGTLEPVAWSSPGMMPRTRPDADGIDAGWGPDGRAALTTETAVVHDIGGNDNFLPWLDDPPGTVGVHAVVALPIAPEGPGVPFGQLAVYTSYPWAFADRERSALESLARAVATRLEAFGTEQWQVGDGVGREHLDEVVAAFPGLAVVHDEDGRYVDVLTPHQIRNYAEPRELVGEHVDDVLPPRAAANVLETLESVFETDDVKRVEYPIEVGDEPLWYEAKVAPADLPDGRRVAVATIRETTERKETERELSRQIQRTERLAGILSHDLRNHLAKASGWVDLAYGAADGDLDELERAEESLDGMDTLLEQAVTMVRGSHGCLDTEPVDVGALAERCWENLPERGQLRVDPGLTPIVADRDRLVRLLENLLTNAVEHAGPDATIRIGAAERGFYVADDGPGVDPSKRDSVFDFGYSTATDGTGFGLAIVEGIAEAHGWSVSLTESERGGARFEFEGVEWATADDTA